MEARSGYSPFSLLARQRNLEPLIEDLNAYEYAPMRKIRKPRGIVVIEGFGPLHGRQLDAAKHESGGFAIMRWRSRLAQKPRPQTTARFMARMPTGIAAGVRRCRITSPSFRSSDKDFARIRTVEPASHPPTQPRSSAGLVGPAQASTKLSTTLLKMRNRGVEVDLALWGIGKSRRGQERLSGERLWARGNTVTTARHTSNAGPMSRFRARIQPSIACRKPSFSRPSPS